MAETRTRPHATPTRPFLALRGGETVYLSPDLGVGVDEVKGRQVVAKRTIRRGDVLIVDSPYALVPAMEVDEPSFSLCSGCNRRMPRSDQTKVPCECTVEVVWCSHECRARDKRHGMECEWLRQLSPKIRAAHGDADFGLLWLIARIIINKHVTNDSSTKDDMCDDHFTRKGWAAVWNLEGGLNAFPDEKITHWRKLTNAYLMSPLLGARLSAEDTVTLICKVELNSFGLYPGITGEYPVESFISRGEYYGGGVYPTAAMFNHACCPNVTHRLDIFGRRIFEAQKDIEVGEECCISYFDLVEFMDSKERRTEIKKSWSFDCGCTRCVEEGEFELPQYLKEFDFF